MVTGWLAAAVAPAAAAGGVPFRDPNAHGSITLCDRRGHPVTSGRVAGRPFTWTAVASVAAPSEFRGSGQNAALTIYQPRTGVDPGDWNGDQLTGASFYRSATPAAVATYRDLSLATFSQEFPSQWDGYYQLRMYVGRAGYGDYTATYPAAVIKVQGSRWSLVQGGGGNCAAARATSSETYAGIPVTKPGGKRGGVAATRAGDGPTASRRAAGAAQSAGTSELASAGSSSRTSSGPSTGDTIALVGVIVVAVGVMTAWSRRPAPFIRTSKSVASHREDVLDS